jgi:hypothetical protein
MQKALSIKATTWQQERKRSQQGLLKAMTVIQTQF